MKFFTSILVVFASLLVSACGGGGGGGGSTTSSSSASSSTVGVISSTLQWRLVNDGTAYNWSVANSLCTSSGWRLPTLQELGDYAKTGNGGTGGYAWTSTPAVSVANAHYVVTFNDKSGNGVAYDDGSGWSVRCVK